MATTEDTFEDPNILHFILLIGGGLCTGTGILNLYWSFGWEGADINANNAEIGFNGIDNFQLLAAADYAIPLLVVGLFSMIIANATAWKRTGGY